MLEELGLIGVVKTDASSFVETSYQSSQNKAQPMVILDKELTFTLITGYSVKLRHLIVIRWLELEGSGFERVSAQAAVVDLIEREKVNRLQSRRLPKSPISPLCAPMRKSDSVWIDWPIGAPKECSGVSSLRRAYSELLPQSR